VGPREAVRILNCTHIIDLHEVGLITEAVLQRVPPDLLPRLREIIESEPE
jgi:hypothetical protein